MQRFHDLLQLINLSFPILLFRIIFSRNFLSKFSSSSFKRAKILIHSPWSFVSCVSGRRKEEGRGRRGIKSRFNSEDESWSFSSSLSRPFLLLPSPPPSLPSVFPCQDKIFCKPAEGDEGTHETSPIKRVHEQQKI